MRIRYGRTAWQPSHRLDGLIRLAFIGDSHTFGQGVAPDETLPAQAERNLNQILPGYPVECVNHGISGYNLWNSWLEFREIPQVYDGVVLILCHNDADPLCRTYHCGWPSPDDQRWQPGSTWGEEIARCFEEIAAYCREHALPIAILYSNRWKTPPQLAISSILTELCAHHHLLFIDSLPLYEEEGLPINQSIVSEADPHPSAAAYQLLGRRLALTLRKEGWFKRSDKCALDDTPERILAVAQKMLELDGYPLDAVVNWATAALRQKSALARRSQETGQSDFSGKAEQVSKELDAWKRFFVSTCQMHTLVAGAFNGQRSLVDARHILEDESVSLRELAWLLRSHRVDQILEQCAGKGDIPSILASPPDDSTTVGLEEAKASLQALQKDLADFRIGRPSSLPTSERSDGPAHASQDILMKQLDLTLMSCFAADAAAKSAELALMSAETVLTGAMAEAGRQLIAKARVVMARTIEPAGAQYLRAFGAIHDNTLARYTRCEVTFSTDDSRTEKHIYLSVMLKYEIPYLPSFTNNAVFFPSATQATCTRFFPSFFSGRVILRCSVPPNTSLDFNLIRVKIRNGVGNDIYIDPADFHRDRFGSLISPTIILI